MKNFIEQHKDNAMLGTLFASILSIIISVCGALYTYQTNISIQDRQGKLEAIAAFDQSNNGVIQAVGEFLFAINEKKDTSEAKKKIAQLAAKQSSELARLRILFAKAKYISIYQENLDEFNKIAQHMSDASEMRAFIEGFDRVNNSKTSALQELYSIIGVSG